MRASTVTHYGSWFPSIIRWLVLLSLLTGLPLYAQGDDRLSIYTVNYPLQYFAQRIAGEHATVVFPAPAAVDPAFWQPDIETILAYQRADLILLNGAGYAKWVQRASLPFSKLVDTSARFRMAYITAGDTMTHRHGPGGDNSHAGTAFTTWLDPDLAQQQARAILEALVRKRPGHGADFEANFSTLNNELAALDAELERITAQDKNRPLLASHPVYQYFARRYDLDLQSVLWEPDVVPGEAQWRQLQKILRSHPARWMIWEAEPEDDSVRRLEAAGVRSIVLESCANTPRQGDFMRVMHENVARLGTIFQSKFDSNESLYEIVKGGPHGE